MSQCLNKIWDGELDEDSKELLKRNMHRWLNEIQARNQKQIQKTVEMHECLNKIEARNQTRIRRNFWNKTCTSDSTRSKRGPRKRFGRTFETNHALMSQQDEGEEPDEDSKELLKGNMHSWLHKIQTWTSQKIRTNFWKESCTTVSTRWRQGTRRRFEQTFKKNRVQVLNKSQAWSQTKIRGSFWKESCTSVNKIEARS